MKKIYKYTLHSYPTNLSLPVGAKFLSVQAQHNEPQIWFLVDPTADKEIRQFACVSTGKPLYIDKLILTFLGTFQLDNGNLVFHCFEVIK